MNQPDNHKQTRDVLLVAAYNEFRKHGYQAASINEMLKDTGLTKGALYHHFSSKLDLGYAVIDEIIWEKINSEWIKPLDLYTNPIDALESMLSRHMIDLDDMDKTSGILLHNLAQEMSSRDEGFSQRIVLIYKRWESALIDQLQKGMKNHQISPDADLAGIAKFFIAMIEGCTGLAKSYSNSEICKACILQMQHYLHSLKTS